MCDLSHKILSYEFGRRLRSFKESGIAPKRVYTVT